MKIISLLSLLTSLQLLASSETFDFQGSLHHALKSHSKRVRVVGLKKSTVFNPKGSLKKTFQTGHSLQVRVNLGNNSLSGGFVSLGTTKLTHEESLPVLSPVYGEGLDTWNIINFNEISSFATAADFCEENFPSEVERMSKLMSRSKDFLEDYASKNSGEISFKFHPSQPLGVDDTPELDLGFNLDEMLQG